MGDSSAAALPLTHVSTVKPRDLLTTFSPCICSISYFLLQGGKRITEEGGGHEGRVMQDGSEAGTCRVDMPAVDAVEATRNSPAADQVLAHHELKLGFTAGCLATRLGVWLAIPPEMAHALTMTATDADMYHDLITATLTSLCHRV
jgi:hypothetical protein